MDADRDVELIGRETCYDGFFRLEKLRLRHRRFDDDWTPVLDREIVARRPAVAVLPYDPQTDRVVLLEQFRPAAYVMGRRAWMVEIPAGLTEPGETLRGVAVREVREEIGLDVEALEAISEFMPSPGGFTEVISLFCARVRAEGAGGIFGLEEEHEDIRSFSVPVESAVELLAEPGRIENAITIIALQWLALNRASLRDRWLAGLKDARVGS